MLSDGKALPLRSECRFLCSLLFLLVKQPFYAFRVLLPALPTLATLVRDINSVYIVLVLIALSTLATLVRDI